MDEKLAAEGMLMLTRDKKLDGGNAPRSAVYGDVQERRGSRQLSAQSLTGLVVDVPAKHFGLGIPGFYYRYCQLNAQFREGALDLIQGR